MKFKKDESADKLRGGYYTPAPIAAFLTRWALATKPKSILEPSCGDGAFIAALNGKHRNRIRITAVEWIKEEAKKSESVAKLNKLLDASVLHQDFLAWAHLALDRGETFDAVIGNPPYIRYQYLEPKDQVLAERIFQRFNLPFSKRTNAWVPFVIASIAMLKPGGRLAMVIPAEILHVLHAHQLRQFLLIHCESIAMVDPQELLFEDALQGTVLLMAIRKLDTEKPGKGVTVITAGNNDFLATDPSKFLENTTYLSGEILNGKWMKVFLSKEELETLERARKLKSVHRFVELASVDVGIVTGANKFFLVDDSTIRKFKLEEFAQPMFGRSEHCKGVIYDLAAQKNNKELGLPCNFIMFDKTPISKLPKGARDYIAQGEAEGLHTRYKCRIRSPWYSVPSIYSTELGMLKRSHHFPRLIHNTAGAYTTDTAYRIRASDCDPATLVYCFVNTLTCLTAELEGRHYGGGVLELVPSEIEKLLVPLPIGLKPKIKDLNKLILNGASSEEILATQDKHILREAGLSAKDCTQLAQALARIRSRRQRSQHEMEVIEE